MGLEINVNEGLGNNQFVQIIQAIAVLTHSVAAIRSEQLRQAGVLETIISKENQLQMTTQEALKIIQDTNDLTTKQGQALQSEGDTLQKISDKFDELVKNGTVPQAVADALTPLMQGVKAVSDTIDAHAALSTAILNNAGPTPPVPAPTPDPTVP